MRYAITIALLLTIAAQIQAQNPKLDSLNRLISRTTSDTGRIKLLNEKITLLIRVNIDSALRLSLKNIEHARHINYKPGEALARILLAKSYNYKGAYAAAKQNLKVAEVTFSALKDSAHLLKVYNTYGAMYGMQSKFDSSLLFLEKGRLIGEQHSYSADLATTYANMGISYKMLSNQPQALRYEQKALTLAEAVHDIPSQATFLVNIANTYRGLGDNKRAEQHFNQAIGLAKQAGIKDVQLYAYTNLAGMYGDLHRYQKAYEFAMKAAQLGQQMGNQAIQATSLSRAAVNLAEQKKFTEAEALSRQAIALAEAAQQTLNQHQTYAALGTILRLQAKYGPAISYFEKSFGALKDADIYDAQTGDIYAELATCYEAMGKYRQALATFKTATSIADSVRGKENVRKATELSMNYEFAKQQQVAQAKQQQQNALAHTRQVALLVGMALTLALAAVSGYAYFTKQKANALLHQQKAELQRALTERQTLQTQLIQSGKMASLGELTAGIAHEIQNPLNFVNNFSDLSIDLIGEMQEERQKVPHDQTLHDQLMSDLVNNLTKINHHGQRAAHIVKSMLEHARSSTGDKQLTDLNTLTEEYLRLAYQAQRTNGKDVSTQLITRFDTTLSQVWIVPQEIAQVLLNLFSNAFYAAREKQKILGATYQPTVTVSTDQQNGQVKIRVRDNGNGMDRAVLEKMFHPFFTTKPTGQGTGLGLSLSYDIVTKGHGGTLTATTQVGSFAEFEVSLPIGV